MPTRTSCLHSLLACCAHRMKSTIFAALDPSYMTCGHLPSCMCVRRPALQPCPFNAPSRSTAQAACCSPVATQRAWPAAPWCCLHGPACSLRTPCVARSASRSVSIEASATSQGDQAARMGRKRHCADASGSWVVAHWCCMLRTWRYEGASCFFIWVRTDA